MRLLTKAETLYNLQGKLKNSRIEKTYYFSYSDWKSEKEKILSKIRETFSGKIVVRSSAKNEDTMESSMAGYFDSVLNVNSQDRIDVEKAVVKVLDSYRTQHSGSAFNFVLIQSQPEDI